MVRPRPSEFYSLTRLDPHYRVFWKDGDPTVVDRDRLTDRQREVVRMAHRMGYFSCPREATATAVADELGIGPSTFAEHLAAAQRTLFEDVFRT